MTAVTVNTDVMHSEAAAAYFNRADRRIKIGMRTALEMLGLPLPDYAERMPPGVKPGRVIHAAFNRDNPRPRPTPTYTPHVPVSADRVEAAKERAARRLGISRPADAPSSGTLFNDVFGG